MIHIITVNSTEAIFLNRVGSIFQVYQRNKVDTISFHEIMDITIKHSNITMQDVVDFMRKYRKVYEFESEYNDVIMLAESLGFVEAVNDKWMLTELGMIAQKKFGLKW